MRYVQSGTCQGCVNASNSPIFTHDNHEIIMAHEAVKQAQAAFEEVKRVARQKEYEELQERKRKAAEITKGYESNTVRSNVTVAARKEAKSNLKQVRFRLHDVDIEAFAAHVWLMTAMRYPVITQADISAGLRAIDKSAGTGSYALYCHSEDVPALQAEAHISRSKHRINMPEAMERVMAQLQAYLPVDTTPPMNFD